MTARQQVVADCLAGYKNADGNPILAGVGGAANFGETISRAQFAAILVRLAEVDGVVLADVTPQPDAANPTFSDVPGTNALFNSVEYAAALDLFDGVTADDATTTDVNEATFVPGGRISYAQVVKSMHNYMTSRGEDVTTVDATPFRTGLDCGAFNAELAALEGRSMFNAESQIPAAPRDCKSEALRGEGFDFLAALNAYQVAVDPARNKPASFVPPTNQAFTITPSDMVTLTNQTEAPAGTTPTADDRQFSASGVTDGTTYRLALYPTANITVDGNGVVTFADKPVNGQADGKGSAIAQITVINGTAVAATSDTTAMPAGGAFNVTIDGVSSGTVTLVIFNDADKDGELDVDAKFMPTEAFAVSGSTKFTNPKAGAGPIAASVITTVTKASKTIELANGFSYVYDDNDQFYIGGISVANQVTQAVFESKLTKGDSIDGTNTSDPSFVSTFNLTNTNPTTPTFFGPAVRTDVQARLDLTATSIATDATVNVYVGPGGGGAFDKATDTLKKSVTADEDTTKAEYQVTVTGLTPNTSYDCFVSQTVDGEESTISAPTDCTTTLTPSTIAITGVSVADDLNDGVTPVAGGSNEVRVDFDKAVQTCTATAGDLTLTVTGQPSISITSTTCVVTPGNTFVVYTMNADLADSNPDTTYNVTLKGGAVTTTETGNPANAQLTSTLKH